MLAGIRGVTTQINALVVSEGGAHVPLIEEESTNNVLTFGCHNFSLSQTNS
jgi:hypothetical protein